MPALDSTVVFPLVLGLVMIVPAGWMGQLNSRLRRRADDNIAATDEAAAAKPRPDYDGLARFYAWAYRGLGAFFLSLAVWNYLMRR
jgi:hypothetical protein